MDKMATAHVKELERLIEPPSVRRHGVRHRDENDRHSAKWGTITVTPRSNDPRPKATPVPETDRNWRPSEFKF